jgi:DNA-binding response OmpR family regulator
LKRAFIFDDDADIRIILKEVLKQRGYEVLGFNRAALCQTCLCPQGQMCADIMISDVSMPNLTGVQFAQHQRMVGCRNENIVLMSGAWTEECLTQARALGCSVLHKPFMIDELTAWVDKFEKRSDPNRALVDWFPEYAHPSITEEDD